MSDVEFEKRAEGVGLITLNRPDSMNAMGGELVPLLGEYLEECERDRSVRCVAITGAGRAFCAGGDVKGFAAGTRRPGEGRDGDGQRDGERPSLSAGIERAVENLRRAQNATSLRLHTMPKPTVALVNGAAAGAGLSLALAPDIRFCSDQARFITAFWRVGLSGDFGGSYYLTKLVGFGRARELYFTGETVDAAKALQWGIANYVVPHDQLMDKGLEFCARLARGPSAAYARMKANLNRAETAALREALDQEALNMHLSSLGRDFVEGSRSWVEKREPNFVGE